MRLFLVRHAQSLANKNRKHQGAENEWRDTFLSNTGKTQAKKVAERLKNEKFDLIYSSPLKRAKQTAEIINKFHNKKIIFDDRIKEMHDEHESKEEFVSRVQNFYEEMKKKEGTILVVAHGGSILNFLAISTGNREKGGELYRRFCFSTGNTSINVLESENSRFKIKLANCVNHLGKRYKLKNKSGILYNIPYKIKPFILEEITEQLKEGDCRHKTELLKQLLEKDGFKVRKAYVVFDWRDLPLPENILGVLNSRTKMVHELLEVKLNNKWLKIDFTWNRGLKEKGFPITKNWNGKEDTKMITMGKINFYKTKEEAKKEKGINHNKEELHEFAEKLNEWISK